MIRKETNMSPTINGIPRESGDDPDPALAAILLEAYSPRERG